MEGLEAAGLADSEGADAEMDDPDDAAGGAERRWLRVRDQA